jgi:putative ABC transport system ATP-binding protein
MAAAARWNTLAFHDVYQAFDSPTGSVEVLRGINVTIPLNGITALVGPSGSGKSAVLRLCNRLEVPTSGCVTLDDTDLADLDPLALRRRVGMVFQRPVLFAGTVADNLAVAAASINNDAPAATAALERCGLDAGLLERTADQLSGGEAQRMCLARTLLTGPEVVLMDEVTSSLDPQSRTIVEDLAVDLAASGIAVLWVTHDHDQARRLASRTVVLDDGVVVAVEPS